MRTSIALIALCVAACGGPETTETRTFVQAPVVEVQPAKVPVSDNKAAEAAIACAGGWPKIRKEDIKLNPETPMNSTLYFHFPVAVSVIVTPDGMCRNKAPETLISATPVLRLTPHLIINTGFEPQDRVSILLLVKTDKEGNRHFFSMHGTNGENMLTDPPCSGRRAGIPFQFRSRPGHLGFTKAKLQRPRFAAAFYTTPFPRALRIRPSRY